MASTKETAVRRKHVFMPFKLNLRIRDSNRVATDPEGAHQQDLHEQPDNDARLPPDLDYLSSDDENNKEYGSYFLSNALGPFNSFISFLPPTKMTQTMKASQTMNGTTQRFINFKLKLQIVPK